jgi:hypothetical protein
LKICEPPFALFELHLGTSLPASPASVARREEPIENRSYKKSHKTEKLSSNISMLRILGFIGMRLEIAQLQRGDLKRTRDGIA